VTEFQQLAEMVIAGDRSTGDHVQKLLAEGVEAEHILNEALLPGMEIVGQRMKTGEMFIPEVLLSARIMQECLTHLEEQLSSENRVSLGTVVLGTVAGDVHDIGKNLVGMMLQGAGFTVVNLGNSVEASVFVDAAREHEAEIVAMSALLTTTLPAMSEVIGALNDAGLRDRVKVLVGGAPVTESYAEQIGADGYGANAVYAVEKAKALVAGE
jgi:5-methyltetrahydrofolate--homocysteine methyltransferase